MYITVWILIIIIIFIIYKLLKIRNNILWSLVFDENYELSLSYKEDKKFIDDILVKHLSFNKDYKENYDIYKELTMFKRFFIRNVFDILIEKWCNKKVCLDKQKEFDIMVEKVYAWLKNKKNDVEKRFKFYDSLFKFLKNWEEDMEGISSYILYIFLSSDVKKVSMPDYFNVMNIRLYMLSLYEFREKLISYLYKEIEKV